MTTLCSLLWLAIKALPDMLLNNTGGVIGDGTPLNWQLHWRHETIVSARGPGAGSVDAGRVLRRKSGHLWLVFSVHGTAFTKVVAGHQEVLWAQHNPGRPVFIRDRMQVCWPDESTIRIWPPRHAGEPRTYSAAEPHHWPGHIT